MYNKSFFKKKKINSVALLSNYVRDNKIPVAGTTIGISLVVCITWFDCATFYEKVLA